MHLGLIGGIGPAATDFYYRRLITRFAARPRPLDLTIVHADTPTLLSHLASNDQEAQVAIYRRLTQRLHDAGAECVAVTSIAGHFCIEAFKAQSPLPVIDLIAEVRRDLDRRALNRVGILGTRTAMVTRLYGGMGQTEIVPPEGDERDAVHEAYVAMAAAGSVTEAQRQVFHTASRRLMEEQKVEAIMLGGTDLALVFSEHDSAFPLVDCAGIHADALAALP